MPTAPGCLCAAPPCCARAIPLFPQPLAPPPAGKLTIKTAGGQIFLDPTSLSISTSGQSLAIGNATNPHTLFVSGAACTVLHAAAVFSSPPLLAVELVSAAKDATWQSHAVSALPAVLLQPSDA